MNYRLGIDLGTSYFKFGIYDENLNLKGLGRVAVETESRDGSLCEVSSEKFIHLLQTGINLACEEATILPSRIDAIGYSSQANSFILLDEACQPLTPLILWPDNRADKLYPEVEQLWSEPDFLETTGIGIPAPPRLCINKLLWFKHQKPDIWSKTQHVMTISDYLTFLFTGEKNGDIGTASLLGLLDCKNQRYWKKAFEILDLDENLFSKRSSVGTKLGSTDEDAMKLFGLKKKTLLFAGSLDHHMAALGAGINGVEDISISIGTVLACINVTEDYHPQKDVCISPWTDGQFCQLAFDGNGAVSLEWYQTNFSPEYSLDALNKLATDAGNSNELIAKQQAFQYQHLEDAFENIKPHHSHGHFVYALMESTANTLKILTEKLCPNRKPRRAIAAGGGAKSKLWLEIISKTTGIQISPSNNTEPATAGAVVKL